MINREIIRIKIVQLTYAYYQNGNKNIDTAEKELFFSLSKAYDLYNQLLSLIVAITREAQRRQEVLQAKALREGSKMPSAKFISNRFALQLESNIQLGEFMETQKRTWADYPEFIGKMFEQIEQSQIYQDYMNDKEDSYAADREVWRKLYRTFIQENEDLDSLLEEQSLYWNDDKDVVDTFVLKTIKRFDENNGDKQASVKNALNAIQATMTDMEIRIDYASWLHRNYRQHEIEAIGKFTLALSCLIFFFIGAPLGAIIRKGGLGMPVIISVLVFIVYYIFDNSGMRMARDGQWTILFGKLISTAILTPIAVFFTYKANKDSTVFNIDLYKNFFMKLLGLRQKRHIFGKEVIIEDPHYQEDAEAFGVICEEIEAYSENHKLLRWPDPIKVFFHAGDDQEIETISERMEAVIEDLGNTKDRIVLAELNNLPILAVRAHTRPFRQKWLNIITGLVIPVGAFFYIRMIRFRIRLYRDLRTIRQVSERIIPRIEKLAEQQKKAI